MVLFLVHETIVEAILSPSKKPDGSANRVPVLPWSCRSNRQPAWRARIHAKNRESFIAGYLELLAGLGIFLFRDAVDRGIGQGLSGRAFRRIIRMYTNGRLRSIGSGALVTALLQSSSAVSLMVLAFVGAGV
jgi:hypothetical protein